MIKAIIKEDLNEEQEFVRTIIIDQGYYGGWDFKDTVEKIRQDCKRQNNNGNFYELKVIPKDPNIEVRQFISKNRYLVLTEYPLYDVNNQTAIINMSEI